MLKEYLSKMSLAACEQQAGFPMQTAFSLQMLYGNPTLHFVREMHFNITRGASSD